MCKFLSLTCQVYSQPVILLHLMLVQYLLMDASIGWPMSIDWAAGENRYAMPFCKPCQTTSVLAMVTTNSLDFRNDVDSKHLHKQTLHWNTLFIYQSWFVEVWNGSDLVTLHIYLYLSNVRVFIFTFFPQRNNDCPMYIIKYVFLYVWKFHQGYICPFYLLNVFLPVHSVWVYIHARRRLQIL